MYTTNILPINETSEEETSKMKENIQDYWKQWAQERGGDCSKVLDEIIEVLGY